MSWKSMSRKNSNGFVRTAKTKKHGLRNNWESALRRTRARKLPIVLAKWRRNDQEVAVLKLVEFRGQIRLDLRIWRRDASGKLFATHKGVPIPLRQLSLIREGLREAERYRTKLG